MASQKTNEREMVTNCNAGETLDSNDAPPPGGSTKRVCPSYSPLNERQIHHEFVRMQNGLIACGANCWQRADSVD